MWTVGCLKDGISAHNCRYLRPNPATDLDLQPCSLRKVDREPIASALVAAGHFGAGVAEMLLDVGLLDLGRGGEAGAERMAAERQPPLALGQVAAQAGGEGAFLDETDDVLVGQPRPRNPAVLPSDRPEQGTMADAAEPHPSFEESDRAGVGARAAADFDVAPAGLAADGQEGAFGEDFDPAGAVLGLAGPAIEPDDFRAAEAAGEPDRQDRPIAQAAQIHVERRQHGQKFVGKNGGLLEGRAGVPPPDAGQDGGDMPVTDLQWDAELPVAPGDPGQPPLEGRDGEFGAAALDLRREVEADRFRIGRRLRKTLAAQPGGELPPVGGVGALGVVGLRRAGVGLGGLRQRRQAAAEAPGGREQGRGRAGSPGLRRRTFRLSVLRAVPDAAARTAVRVGDCVPPSAGLGLPSAPTGAGAERLSAPIGAGGAGAFEPTAGARVWSSEALARRASRACPAGLNQAMRLRFAGVPAAAAPANSGGGGEGAPAEGDPDASPGDASARFPGSAEGRRFGSDGSGAWGGIDRRPAPSGGSRGGRRCGSRQGAGGALSDAAAVCEARLFQRLQEPSRRPSDRISRRFRSP